MNRGCSHVDHAVLILKRAFDTQELSARDRNAIPFVEIGMDDGIGNSGLIFETQEDKAGRRSEALPRNHPLRRCARRHRLRPYVDGLPE